MPRLDLKVVGNHLHRCNNSSPSYKRENHYAIFVRFENFLRFQVQDRHNASYYFKMSRRELPQSKHKGNENLVKVSR